MEIIQVLLGGLGNQMFMYAAARELATQAGAELTYYFAPKPDFVGRTLKINQFFPDERYINELIPTPGDVHLSGDGVDLHTLVATLKRAESEGVKRVILQGYFQNEKYFPNIGNVVRQQVQDIITRLNIRPAELGVPAVAVHIRRHDYASFGICNDQYYLEAMRWFKQKFAGKVWFFIFTDEPIYSQTLVQEFQHQSTLVISDNEVNDFLSLCCLQHYIISNSSYSWWSAFIGEKEESIIFAPMRPWTVDNNNDPAPTRWCRASGVVNTQLTSAQAQQKIKEARFFSALYRYTSLAGTRFPVIEQQLFPCLEDEFAGHPFEPHYTYHTAWAARKLKQYAPKEHHDFGSCMRFATIASALVERFFYHEYRALNIKLDGFQAVRCDLMDLNLPEASYESISCMHVLEHVGLGRYGDHIDPDGDLKAIAGLKKLVAPEGIFLFVVPMGTERLQYNAHRIYGLESIMAMFDGFELQEFSFIPDNALEVGMLDNPPAALVNSQNHGCGCFVFRKK